VHSDAILTAAWPWNVCIILAAYPMSVQVIDKPMSGGGMKSEGGVRRAVKFDLLYASMVAYNLIHSAR